MKLQRYSDINKFLTITETELLTNEAANNLILGVLLSIRSYPDYYKDKYMAAVFDGNKLNSIAVCTPPFKLLLYTNTTDPEQAFRLIADDLMKTIKIPGVLAESDNALNFARIWHEVTGSTFQPGMSERIYRLNRVTFQNATAGKMRLAVPADLELIARWTREFHLEAIPNDPMTNFEEFVTKKIEKGDLFLWEDGEPVSLASIARPTKNGITVNLVYTPKQNRKKGYATALVADLCKHLLEIGWKFCVLFTDLSNPTSNSIYQKIGFRPICDYQEYYFKGE